MKELTDEECKKLYNSVVYGNKTIEGGHSDWLQAMDWLARQSAATNKASKPAPMWITKGRKHTG